MFRADSIISFISEEFMVGRKAKLDATRGNLDLMVLSIVAEEPSYGYRIQQRLADVSRGMLDIKPGTLYPLLHRLEADKLIRAKWDDGTGRKRKWYELTATGKRRLNQQADQWARYAECLHVLLAPILEKTPSPT
jgi:PadR family transcriptional regulator PadR